MKVKKVNKIEDKYLNLIKLIDSGEYRLASMGENYEGLSRWIATYIFETKTNEGILTAMIFNDNLRFQVAFEKDLDETDVQTIYDMIKDIMNKEKKKTSIWVYNENHNLVKTLMSKFNLHRKNVYMSREIMYFKEPTNIDITPLKTIFYKKEILDDVLELLEDSFVDIAEKNEFINHREYYHYKFSNLNKSRFTGFLLNDKLIGMYFHHDGEIEYVAVSSSLQSKGYGKLIIHHALNAIKEDSNNIPYLYCVDENSKALQFYLREGFEVVAHAARL
ncbi:GNAT family N-acetyltransferase [Mycoplasmatota bacterium]|nr:GNAT family N-acetyltransferase [Mycoplasmatota bacterium]